MNVFTFAALIAFRPDRRSLTATPTFATSFGATTTAWAFTRSPRHALRLSTFVAPSAGTLREYLTSVEPQATLTVFTPSHRL